MEAAARLAFRFSGAFLPLRISQGRTGREKKPLGPSARLKRPGIDGKLLCVTFRFASGGFFGAGNG